MLLPLFNLNFYRFQKGYFSVDLFLVNIAGHSCKNLSISNLKAFSKFLKPESYKHSKPPPPHITGEVLH